MDFTQEIGTIKPMHGVGQPPFTGIDFSMTALFVIIFVSQWEKAESHFAAIAGIVVSLGCLFVFGPDHFMLPALAFVSILLAAYNQHKAVVK